MMTQARDATELLHRLCRGDAVARDEFAPILHEELRKLAVHHLRGERQGHTLSATELVHDAWVRLIRPDAGDWESRRQFYALASRMMRSLLVDHARQRDAVRRGGGVRPITLHTDSASWEGGADIDVIVLDDALRRLEQIDEELARIAELRLFTGAEMKQVAEQFGLPMRTAERRWRSARVWLTKELRDD